jgi:hypothetical protein
MNDRPRRWALIAVGVNVSHHVVAELPFVLVGGSKVDRVDMGPQLRNLRWRDRQAQLGLGLREPDPELTPQAMPALGAPQAGHLRRSVAGDQRIVVNVVGHWRES